MSMEDTSIRRHQLTVDDYYRMAEVGILAPDARVELIEGEIVDVAPIGSRHSSTVNRLNRALSRAVGTLAIVQVRGPVRLSMRSEPQPDIALLRNRDDFYGESHPTPRDALLVVEVANTTLAYDRNIKMPLYARHGVVEAWLIDLQANRLHCFSEPADGVYQRTSTITVPGAMPLSGLPGVAVDLAGIF